MFKDWQRTCVFADATMSGPVDAIDSGPVAAPEYARVNPVL